MKEHKFVCNKGVFLSVTILLHATLMAKLSQNFHRFVTLCNVWMHHVKILVFGNKGVHCFKDEMC